jgi:hypothetical protein
MGAVSEYTGGGKRSRVGDNSLYPPKAIRITTEVMKKTVMQRYYP